MNTDAPGPVWPADADQAWFWVRTMQRKLHQWAAGESGRRFDDLYNLVYHPCFLTVAWEIVRGNRGARAAGIDGIAPRSLGSAGAFILLERLHLELKQRMFRPAPVRQVLIPKTNGKMRSLGIGTVADRVVQAALKLVLEPIFEADFYPCSYGFRPGRRAQDAIAEIHYLASGGRDYMWVFEADIKACFDEIDHTALMQRIRGRIADKRVLTLVKMFLKAGILTQDQAMRDNLSGTPQGGILSPLLANIALTIVDEHFAAKWEALGPDWKRVKHRRSGGATYRLVRYADDFVVMVHGTRQDAEALRDETSTVLAPMGLRLSEEKTRIVHLDEGFDFLGWRIQRQTKRGTNKRYVYTWPSKKALASIVDKVRALTRRHRHRTLADLLRWLNPALRGWCNYFKHGVSKQTFSWLYHYAWTKTIRWLWKRHHGLNWGTLKRRYLPDWQIRCDRIELFRPDLVEVTRYRYRGTKIPTPWTATPA